MRLPRHAGPVCEHLIRDWGSASEIGLTSEEGIWEIGSKASEEGEENEECRARDGDRMECA